MDTLYSWSAKRSAAAITVAHSCGKLAGVTGITTDRFGRVVAEHPEFGDLQLSTAAHRDAETDTVNGGISDLFFNHDQVCEAYRACDVLDERDQPTAPMREAAEGFQTMLRAAGVVPPTVAALVADFAKRL